MALSPEKLADDSIFKYRLRVEQLPAAQAQIQLAFGTKPVLMMVNQLDPEWLELLVLAPALTASQSKVLSDLQSSNLQMQALPAGQIGIQTVQFVDEAFS